MLSDNQKRFACRLAFLVLCVLPTAATTYHIFHRPTAADWQQQIQSQLGVHTRIDSVETPGPYETILRGVKFYDADLNPILESTEARVRFGEVNQIVLNYPVSLTSNGLRHITDQLNQQLIRSHSITKPWQIFVRSAVVQSNLVGEDQMGTWFPRELRLEDVLVTVASQVERTLAEVEFSLIDVNSPTPAGQPNRIRCALHRERANSFETAGQMVELNTGDDALPCWLAHAWLPTLNEMMGTEAEFSGHVQLDVGSPFLAGQAQGWFTNVDLQKMGGPNAPSNAFANASLPNPKWQIELQRLVFAGDEIVEQLAYKSTPGSGLPRTKFQIPFETYQRATVAQALRDATTGNGLRLNDGALVR